MRGAALREVVAVDLAALAAVEIRDPNAHAQGIGQRYDVYVVTLLGHWFHFLFWG